MPTGYEISYYRDIERIRRSLESLAKSGERIATATEKQANQLAAIQDATEATAAKVTGFEFVPEREKRGPA